MNRHLTLLLCASLLLVCTFRLVAEHASIDLTLVGTGPKVEAFSDQEPPAGGVNRRPVLTARSGERLELQFFLTNVYPHGRVKNVTVRYYVRRMRDAMEDRGGSRPLEDERSATTRDITSGTMVLNFKPKCRVGARVRFRAPAAGRYLVRMETEGTQSDHEHFAAVELLVAPE